MPQQSLSKFYFSFEGRVNRRDYWLKYVLPLLLPAIIMGAVFEEVTGYKGSLVFLIVFWPGLAISVKRWHDRDKSGWWVLIGLIPIIGGIWVLVENGFLPGTPGPNRFDAKPAET